ncbi:MAG: CHASE2 domain-containing protein [Spirochaetaceae bacterium]|nr:CHASE2 domain-containing protein [Spirochaetaceae bacterium]
MEKRKDSSFFSQKSAFIASCFIIIVFFSVGLSGGFTNMDNNIFDLMLRVAPEPTISSDVLFLDIDDESLNQEGTWPWSRDILADVLIRAKELGADAATFDIEYLSPSQKGINPDVVEEIPVLFSDVQGQVASILEEMGLAFSTGQVEVEYIPDVTSDILQNNILPTFDYLFDSVSSVSRDNDDYFGRAIQFFGNTWLTVNLGDIISTTDEVRSYVENRFMLDFVVDEENLTYKANRNTFKEQNITEGFAPALQILMERAAGAGFTNVIIDSGGTRRRVDLLYEKDGKYLPQLIFAPLLDRIDAQGLERSDRKLTIKNALLPGSTVRQDVVIPLDRDGYMLINWFHGDFLDGFKHYPVISLRYLDALEAQIETCINWFYQDLYLLSADGNWLDYYVVSSELAAQYSQLTAEKKRLLLACNGFDEFGNPKNGFISDQEYEDYFAARKTFFASCEEFANGSSLQEIYNRLEELLAEGTPAEEIEAFWTTVEETFSFFKTTVETYNQEFNKMNQDFTGAFCIIGNSATGNTDLGTTPFVARYPNVGTHGNTYNTIINQEFIQPMDWQQSFLIAVIFALIFSWFGMKMNLKFQMIIGITSNILLPVLSIVLMHFWRIWMPFFGAFLVLFLTYISVVVLRFVYTEQDKRFIKHAFSTYLSKDVVNDIISNPEKLALGGTEREITALFSDIKSFSSLSENVTPSQLVSILNDYLTRMSDLILDQSGTIDKYIGDAIVSFFGAPVDLPDHAFRACAAAVRIKQAEEKLNEEYAANQNLPMPILTRIGINTGNMVVGNMGTSSKMNYTIMGNHVNIAARLEGVNKVYNSWILVSENTWQAANRGEHEGELAARRLDKVRVMGIDKPIQLYNILGFTEEMTDAELSAIKLFHEGLDAYLCKKFTEAKRFFEQTVTLNPKDRTPQVFIDRCKKYITTPPPENWDGVMTMSTK